MQQGDSYISEGTHSAPHFLNNDGGGSGGYIGGGGNYGINGYTHIHDNGVESYYDLKYSRFNIYKKWWYDNNNIHPLGKVEHVEECYDFEQSESYHKPYIYPKSDKLKDFILPKNKNEKDGQPYGTSYVHRKCYFGSGGGSGGGFLYTSKGNLCVFT